MLFTCWELHNMCSFLELIQATLECCSAIQAQACILRPDRAMHRWPLQQQILWNRSDSQEPGRLGETDQQMPLCKSVMMHRTPVRLKQAVRQQMDQASVCTKWKHLRFTAGSSFFLSGHAMLRWVRVCGAIQQGCDMICHRKHMLHCCNTAQTLLGADSAAQSLHEGDRSSKVIMLSCVGVPK